MVPREPVVVLNVVENMAPVLTRLFTPLFGYL